MTKFIENDKIRTEGKHYQCIIANDEIAVFGSVAVNDGETSVSYEDVFIISQTVQDGFVFDDFIGICEHTGRFIFEGDDYLYDKEENNYYLK